MKELVNNGAGEGRVDSLTTDKAAIEDWPGQHADAEVDVQRTRQVPSLDRLGKDRRGGCHTVHQEVVHEQAYFRIPVACIDERRDGGRPFRVREPPHEPAEYCGQSLAHCPRRRCMEVAGQEVRERVADQSGARSPLPPDGQRYGIGAERAASRRSHR